MASETEPPGAGKVESAGHVPPEGVAEAGTLAPARRIASAAAVVRIVDAREQAAPHRAKPIGGYLRRERAARPPRTRERRELRLGASPRPPRRRRRRLARDALGRVLVLGPDGIRAVPWSRARAASLTRAVRRGSARTARGVRGWSPLPFSAVRPAAPLRPSGVVPSQGHRGPPSLVLLSPMPSRTVSRETVTFAAPAMSQARQGVRSPLTKRERKGEVGVEASRRWNGVRMMG